MKDSNCRIGKIKFKSGGEMHLLPQEHKNYCYRAVANLSNSIYPDTRAVAFVVLFEDGTTETNVVHIEQTTLAQVKGAVAVLDQRVTEHWNDQ